MRTRQRIAIVGFVSMCASTAFRYLSQSDLEQDTSSDAKLVDHSMNAE
jgi:hypothetical protein